MLKLRGSALLEEKKTEYNIVFVDYNKTFDHVEIWAITAAVDDTRTVLKSITLIKDTYKEATFHVKVNDYLHT